MHRAIQFTRVCAHWLSTPVGTWAAVVCGVGMEVDAVRDIGGGAKAHFLGLVTIL